MIYIDAEHTYESVKNDLNWYYFLNKNGVLFGHDIFWDDVRKAVEEFCEDNNKKYKILYNTFWVII